MEITGDDHVIFTFENPHAAIAEFILALQHAWPPLSIDYTEPDFQYVYAGSNAAFECGQAVKTHERSSLFFYCNVSLRQHHEENGYVLDQNGIGPFAILIRKRKGVEFQLNKVEEAHSDRDMSVAGVPEPYLAWLAARLMFEVTVVTPSHDQRSEFTDHILKTLLKCLRDQPHGS